MVGICFFFEESDVDVWSGHNLDAWNYAIKAAGDVDSLIVINRTSMEIQSPDLDIDFNVLQDIPELQGKIARLSPQWQCESNSDSLWNFNHDVDWYIFGPATGPWKGNLFIPQANKAALHAVHIATVVMLHRYEIIYGNYISR